MHTHAKRSHTLFTHVKSEFGGLWNHQINQHAPKVYEFSKCWSWTLYGRARRSRWINVHLSDSLWVCRGGLGGQGVGPFMCECSYVTLAWERLTCGFDGLSPKLLLSAIFLLSTLHWSDSCDKVPSTRSTNERMPAVWKWDCSYIGNALQKLFVYKEVKKHKTSKTLTHQNWLY